ncbi:hypothetical protein GOP47_0019784 [Adiantum capillus-veneris]|uniref:Uncharacterized protein n=1 Tax=Adiantum capillus-veneris TaxID=13818 RepID=A0A9D4UBQ0_ADICA|nr:hypothetical protein GOP47_0019784 [Adiantum capillus-veneris]
MTSTPPRQDGAPMGPDANSGKTHFYTPGTAGATSQVPRPAQYQGRSPMSQFTPDQTAGYAYRPPPNQTPGFVYRPPSTPDQAPGFVYRPPSSQPTSTGPSALPGAPQSQSALTGRHFPSTTFGQPAPTGPSLNQPAPTAGPLPSTTFGQMYQRAATPPSFLPPNTAAAPPVSMMPPQPSITSQSVPPYSKNPMPPQPSITSQSMPPYSRPFATPPLLQQTSASAQGPITGSMRGNQSGIPGPFPLSQKSTSSNQMLPPGSVQPTSVTVPPLPGIYQANQNALGPYPSASMGSSMSQAPPLFPPGQASNPMTSVGPNSQVATSSFSSPPNASRTAPVRGPPTFGLPPTSMPGTFRPPSLPNSAPVVPGFPGQLGAQGISQGQGLAHAAPPYPPAIGPAQTSSFGQVATQSSQYPQYAGGPPSLALDGQLNRGTFPYPGAAPPFQSVQGLVEEFQSLSMVTAPGSMESTVDVNALPRPGAETEYPASLSPASSHGRYFRLTCSSLPNSQSLAARWHLPLGAVAHPLAQPPENEEVPVIDFGSSGIIRCRRCRTYINPFAVFTDNGRRWKCNLCSLNNEVPSEYYCPVDQTGRRTDANERPELCQGSVEFIAPAEYMVRPPMPPVYFFLIDVSSSAIKTGMLQIAVDTIRSCLDKLPGYPRTQIGFLTFDSTLHFYSLKSTLTQPQMMVVADLDDPFLPMPDDLLVNLSESRAVVEALLNSLPSMFKDNLNVESAVGPSLRAVFMIMSQLGGKLLFFQSTLPSLGVGRLKIRGDDPRVYGTDKEASLRNPDDPFYKQMAADFSKVQISVNLYAFGDGYMDLASLGTLAKYTAGQIYHYPLFQLHLHGEKFNYELARDLTRETAWEAVLRIRCGKGMRFSTYHGHFMLRSSDLMALPAVDCDKAFAMQLTLEETLLTTQTAYFQSALLYTSSNGERRIRVHTAAAPLVSDLNEMYRSADTGAIVMLMGRLALEKSLVSKLEEVRQQIVQAKLVRALREYQNMFGVQHPLTGRLIYPESLKLLPLYCLSLYKCLALRGGYGNATLDERLSASFDMMVMSVPRLLTLLYPTMFRLDECLSRGGVDVKAVQPLPLTAEKLDSRGAFLFNDGLQLIVWVGSVMPVEFSVQLLGIEAVQSGDLSKAAVVERDNDLSRRFMSLLKSLRVSNPAVYQQCHFVRQGDQPREGFLVLFNLVEDRPAGECVYSLS